jgi:predicted transcriptional regulator
MDFFLFIINKRSAFILHEIETIIIENLNYDKSKALTSVRYCLKIGIIERSTVGSLHKLRFPIIFS